MEKVQTVPIIILAPAALPKDFLDNVNLLEPMQKAVLATTRSVRKFMGNTPVFQIPDLRYLE